jgi:hypothetical protein
MSNPGASCCTSRTAALAVGFSVTDCDALGHSLAPGPRGEGGGLRIRRRAGCRRAGGKAGGRTRRALAGGKAASRGKMRVNYGSAGAGR